MADRLPLVVDPDWIEAHRDDPNLRIVDAKADGHPVDDQPASHPSATFTARRRPELLVTRDEVAAALEDDDTILVNVLDEDTYTGARRTYARPGRIPGSAHVFVGEIRDPETGTLRSPEELRPLFEQAGALDPGKRVVTYCGSGIAATMDALALAALGRDDVAIYGGSMTEWAADESLPLEQG